MSQRAQVVPVWPLGVGLLLAGAALLVALITFWPVRISDVAGAANTKCDPAATSESNPSRGSATAPTQAPTVLPVQGPSAEPVHRALAAAQAQAIDPWDRCISLFGSEPTPIPFDVRILLLVTVAAALGAYVHLATSFGTRLGNRSFDAEWTWWYVLRIPSGVALALIVYLALRGGLLTATAVSDTAVNPFGICALAALVGLFSRQAIDKLRETFDTLFRTAADQSRGKATLLSIVSVSPATFSHLTPSSTVTVKGAGFTSATRATINGTDRTVTFVNATQLDVQLAAADTTAAGSLSLQLTNQGAPPVSRSITVT